MISSRLDFKLERQATGSRARAATFRTLHNEVRTPLFMPVGTQATVKAQLPEALEASGSQILLANTYHLLLRPGREVFRKFGGIHGFMKWEKSVLTDSGGFQIFSLPHSRAMSEEGATFQSYVDGKLILLSPEVSIGTQVDIGSDIMMVLDQCIPSTAPEEDARRAMEITHRWAARSLAARGDSPQSMFAIVQGALFPELRKESAARLTEMPFDGFAIGGLAVGEGKSQREDVCEFTAGLLPADRPRYLMGVGTPLDLLEAVHRGVDMFDCIIPTQVARRGGAFTSRGLVQLRRAVYKLADVPLDPACSCPVCAKYSRAYLHHLYKADEPLGWTLMGQHNIHFYHQLMRDLRQSILEDRFLPLYHQLREVLGQEDEENPNQHPVRLRFKKEPPRTRGVYEVFTWPAGFSCIRQTTSGEIMHAHVPPIEEARALYIDQSALASRVRSTGPDDMEPLVIWDVGLGAAANAMAAILCCEEQAQNGPVRPVQIISFENDLDPLRLALTHHHHFPYLRHGGPATVVEEGAWRSPKVPGLSWLLLPGDFRELMACAPAAPDLIFYDMFSTKSDPDQWNHAMFRDLAAACGGKNTELFTYSTSTAVRAALLTAGFHVALGQATGSRGETTIALTPEAAGQPRGHAHPLLGSAWLGKWTRSPAGVPAHLTGDDRTAYESAIRAHPQFTGVQPQPARK